MYAPVSLRLSHNDLSHLADSKKAWERAAAHAAQRLRETLKSKGQARLILATGASQFEMLHALIRESDIDWSRVTIFHLDEYAEMSPNHPASFRRYLQERFLEQLPVAPAAFHAVGGKSDLKADDLEAECRRLGELISVAPIDVACISIGENANLAFNDPPGNFTTKQAFLVVELDDVCRQQQLGEGWFPRLDAVPRHALTMSIPQILSSQTLIVSVPDERKAWAVKNTIDGPVSPFVPASVLQNHPDTTLHLDHASASLLFPNWKTLARGTAGLST